MKQMFLMTLLCLSLAGCADLGVYCSNTSIGFAQNSTHCYSKEGYERKQAKLKRAYRHHPTVSISSYKPEPVRRPLKTWGQTK